MKMIRVKTTRTFNGHTAGDILLVEETKEIEQLIKSKLFTVLAVEIPTPTPVAALAAPTKPKPKPKGKPKGKGKKDV
jgi:hypothetical protein